MSRVVVVVDVGDGLEGLLFSSQAESERWLEAHPVVDECVNGVISLTTRHQAKFMAGK